MKTPDPVLPEPSEADIQHKAYLLWLEGGCRPGCELENWHAAKEVLRHRLQVETGQPNRKKRPPAHPLVNR